MGRAVRRNTIARTTRNGDRKMRDGAAIMGEVYPATGGPAYGEAVGPATVSRRGSPACSASVTGVNPVAKRAALEKRGVIAIAVQWR
jgi:hypothetical protein